LRAAGVLALTLSSVLGAACSEQNVSDDEADAGAGNAQSGSGGGAGAANAGQGGASAGAGGSGTSGSSATGGASAGMSGASGASGANATGGNGGGAGASAGNAGAAGASAGSGTSGGSGTAGTGGDGAAGTAGAAGSAGATGDGLGYGVMTGMGRSDEQYETTEVGRNDVPYMLITNGWGPGFESHTVSWNGTSFIVEAMSGSPGSGGQPASYPSVFCGRYSVMQVPACGLPAAMDSITSLKTGWRWKANDNTGQYNAAYDIWLGTENGFSMYLMVWLRDPPGQQPAGSPNSAHQGVTVANVPGTWNIWNGTVNNRPIINWVRAEGMDSSEIEFDVMDFVRDGQERGLNVTGTHVNAVAVGFEIWQGPITNLESVDFYVDVN
jgi:hypothetical protein